MNRGSRFTGIWTVRRTAAYRGIAGADELDAALTWAPPDLHRQLAGQLRYNTAIGDDGLTGSLLGRDLAWRAGRCVGSRRSAHR